MNITLFNPYIWCLFEYLPLYNLHVCGVSLTRFMDFKALCTHYLYSPQLKGTNTFWRVRYLIVVFNKLGRNISSGLENTEDELMSDIHFCTTCKGDIPHQFFIFRKKEILGMELNNMVCYSSRTMLYLYIQNGKYVMNTLEFPKDVVLDFLIQDSQQKIHLSTYRMRFPL